MSVIQNLVNSLLKDNEIFKNGEYYKSTIEFLNGGISSDNIPSFYIRKLNTKISGNSLTKLINESYRAVFSFDGEYCIDDSGLVLASQIGSYGFNPTLIIDDSAKVYAMEYSDKYIPEFNIIAIDFTYSYDKYMANCECLKSPIC